MTKRFEVITDNFEISIKDKAVRDYPFSIQCENIDEFEPLLQEVMNVNARLNKTWEQTQRFDKYSQEYLQRANQLEEENEQLKQSIQKYKAILQDMGILRSDEDVVNIRNDIADKLLKPLFKSNGFDVDIDITDGFTIIPKGDVE